MTHIRISGTIDIRDLEGIDVDLKHPTGLSDQGHLNLVAGENGRPLTLLRLEHLRLELADA